VASRRAVHDEPLSSALSSPHVLREYAFVADGVRGALIGPRGDMAWLCVPRWDSDAVFSALLGGQGAYGVSPHQRNVWGGYYEDGTLVWHSRWVCEDSIAECREALRLPADPSVAVVLRRLTAVEGATRFDVALDARAGYGSATFEDLTCEKGIWTARSGPLQLRWSGAPRARVDPRGVLRADIVVEAGEHHDLVLEIADRVLDRPPPDAEVAWSETVEAWRRSVPRFDGVLAARDVRQGYAVLRGMTSPGGGMVAAATLGLPERADAGRNYDYRYAWVRDQCFAGHAVAVTGAHPLLDDAVSFVSERVLADGPTLRPAYCVDGAAVPDERELTVLAGYPGGHPKAGNWVNGQFQLDALGEILLLLAEAGHHDHLDLEHWRAVEATVGAVTERWRDPDAGIWELDDRHWAHSRLSCVAGLRAAAGLAPPAQSARWSGLADTILADVAADCTHPSGRWQRAPDDERVDAALLLPGLRGATPPGDARHRATFEEVVHELGSDGYVYRFRHDGRPLEEAEGAFLFCGFVAALAAQQLGRPVEARAWFERNRAACGSPGLLTEEFDVGERQLRGNVPQAFVHALLVEAAARLGSDAPGA